MQVLSAPLQPHPHPRAPRPAPAPAACVRRLRQAYVGVRQAYVAIVGRVGGCGSDATNVLAAKPRAARRRLRFLRRLFGFPGVDCRLALFFYPLKFFRGLKTNPFPERSDKAAKLPSKKSRFSSSQRFCVYSAVVVCFPAEVSPRGLAERAEDGAAVHGTPLLAVAAEEGADSQRVWEAPEAARFRDRNHPQGPRRNRPCRHPDFAPAGPDLGPEL